ncbi:YHYH protein [Leptospira sp. GIMC2001]|uniref:YHYH protein n=1 Tax=Leptospira sp. GIMC2001 TaxID=1513297 RepID=UPI00300E5C8C
MIKKIKYTAFVCCVGLLITCAEKSDSNDTETFGLLALLLNSSSGVGPNTATTTQTITNATATLNASTGCVTGVVTAMDSALPSWIKDNFKCAVGYVSGSNYVFKATNLPNYKSFYWAGKNLAQNNGVGTRYPLYEDLPNGIGNSAGTNVIASGNYVYTIPANPSVQSGTKTGTQGGGRVSIAITVNGVVVFNNAAAPGDTLAAEVITFDTYKGHPQNTGIYHYHAEPTSISNNNSALIGIALDGYALYGKKCDNGTSATGDDFTPDSTGTNVLDSNHGHTAVTQHFPSATYHYHIAFDSTATIDTLMGSFFHGVAGTATNN